MDDRGLGLAEYRRNRLLKFFTNRWVSEGYNFQVSVFVIRSSRNRKDRFRFLDVREICDNICISISVFKIFGLAFFFFVLTLILVT